MIDAEKPGVFQQPALMFAFKVFEHNYSFPWRRIVPVGVRRAGGRTRRRRLNKLSCAGWVPHDRGFVSGLPHSRDEHRSGDRLITGLEDSPPWPCLRQCAPFGADTIAALLPGFRGAARSGERRLGASGNCPDEADHLASYRRGDHDLRLAGGGQASVSRA